MRKFIITAAEYNGEAVVVYDHSGRLAELNLQQTDMTIEQRHFFKAKVASSLANIAAKFDAATTIIEADYEVPFEQFWKEYGKKINKARCILLWNKMNKAQQLAAWQGIKKYDAYLKKESWRTKADPETYLRNRYWDNEY